MLVVVEEATSESGGDGCVDAEDRGGGGSAPFEPSHSGVADSGDGAGGLEAEDVGDAGWGRIETTPLQQVGTVHRRRLHPIGNITSGEKQ